MSPRKHAEQAAKVIALARGTGSTTYDANAIERTIRAAAAPLVEALLNALTDLQFISEGDASEAAQVRIRTALAAWDAK